MNLIHNAEDLDTAWRGLYLIIALQIWEFDQFFSTETGIAHPVNQAFTYF